MYVRLLIYIVLSLTLLTACQSTGGKNNNTSTQAGQSPMNSPSDTASIDALLDFIAHYADATPHEQHAYFLDNTQALAKAKTNKNLLIKHSAMLALPTSIVKDIPSAKSSLTSLLTNHQLNHSELSLTKLLLTYTHENIEQTNKMDELTKKNELMKQKNKVLSQQLNDLKNIEKTMIERNTSSNHN